MPPEQVTDLRDAMAALILPHVQGTQRVLADAMGRLQALELLAMATAQSSPQPDAVLAAFARNAETVLRSLETSRNEGTAPFLDALRSHALRMQLALEKPGGTG